MAERHLPASTPLTTEPPPSRILDGLTGVFRARIPPILLRLQQSLQDEDCDLVMVGELISLDPILCCQVLRHCQDPPAAQGDPPETLWDATLRMGRSAIRELCQVPAGKDGASLWVDLGPDAVIALEHSLATAAAARALIREIAPGREQEAYLAGLVHDVGVFVMMERHGRDYVEFFRGVGVEGGNDMLLQEKRLFGETHQDCGAVLGAAWNLPPTLRQVIGGHHQRPVKDDPILPRVIALAEQLACAAGLGSGQVHVREEDLHQALAELQLAPHTTERLLPVMFEQLRRVARVVGVAYRAPGDLGAALSRQCLLAKSPVLDLAAARNLLRDMDRLQGETSLALWLRDRVLQHTDFERAFVLIFEEDHACFSEVLGRDEALLRAPLSLEDTEVESLGFHLGRHRFLRARSTHPVLSGFLDCVRSEDLMVVPLQSQDHALPLGVLCCDRRYSALAPARQDLTVVEILSRAVAQDIALRRMTLRLETYKDDAERDFLTNLYNRRSTIKLLDREILRSQRTGDSLCLIMLDIDNFKRFNDIYGHLAGDTVLREVARLLYDNARTVDVVGRYGGEEFLIVLPATSIESAYVFAERLRSVVETYGQSKLTRYPDNPPTISIGVSWVVADRDTAEHAIERVDRALYGSKKGGRNRVCLEPAEVIGPSPMEDDS